MSRPEKLRANLINLGKKLDSRALRKNIKTIEGELRIAAKILDWEIGDLWGHVGARLPGTVSQGRLRAPRTLNGASCGTRQYTLPAGLSG